MYKRADLPQSFCLSQASASGDVDKVISIVSSLTLDKATLNQALLRATEHCTTASDHIQCVEVLLGKGAEVNCKSEEGVSSLMKACELGQIQLVELLWQRGGKIGERGSMGRTPLHYSVDTNFGDNSDVVQFLLVHGADVNSSDILGRTPLHLAAERGAAQSLKVLISAHARLKAYDKRRKTPLDLAVENNRERCVEMLRSAGNYIHPIRDNSNLPRTDREAQKEDPIELGEELETKSGSSYTSNRGNTDMETAPPLLWQRILSKIDHVLTVKRGELREEKIMIDCLEQELAVLEKEKNALVCEARVVKEEMKRKEIAISSVLMHENSVLNRIKPPKVPSFPALLTMKKKPSQASSQTIIHSLHSDMSQFLSDLDSWQRTITPTFTRAVDRWRSFVSLHLPGSQVKVYGSFANNLHLPSSDIDVMVQSSSLGVYESLELLEARCRSEAWITSINLIPAAYIPVLQLILLQDGCSIRLDVTVSESKHRGAKCTLVVRKLLREVGKLREVFLTLKQLFHVCEANVPFRGGLGSYSLFVMTAALIKKEALHTSSEYVYRFFHYYGYEFQYCEAISIDPPCFPASLYPSLFISDPSSIQFNTARATHLPFLVVIHYSAFPTNRICEYDIPISLPM